MEVRAPAQLRVSLVELWEFIAGWVESYKTEEKKKKTEENIKGTGLNVVGTWEPLQFFQQVSYEIKMVFQP